MHLVLLDLVPLLLSWEENDPGSPPRVPPAAGDMLQAVFADFNIAGIGDADQTGLGLRRALEDADIDAWFDYVGTSAEFGPTMTPRVVRHMARMLGFEADQVVVITAREGLAEALRRARLAVVHVEGPEGVAAIPEALEGFFSG